jgi:1-acyl-sn-glycerol-3-phosphate acyltransferase
MPLVGAQNLPSGGPALVVSNHLAYSDTLWLAAHLPPFVLCGAHPRLFRDPVRRAVMAVGQVVPVPDEASLKRDLTALLRGGSVVLHYPEGGRRPKGLQSLTSIWAEVAREVQVPVYPVANTGRRLVAGPPVAPRVSALLDALRALGAPSRS